jgi:hypothetical protein
MKFKLIALAAAAAVLTGCATGPSDYQLYADTQKAMAQARAMTETARIAALSEIARTGDSSSKVAAVMSLQFAAQSQPQSQQMISAPKTTADKLLPWASLLVPSLTQFYSIKQNAAIAINSSDNALEAQKSDNGMIVDLVQGRIPPVIGDEDDVLLYPR